MTWYKRAVDQHQIEPDSFVFSVPFDSGYSEVSIKILRNTSQELPIYGFDLQLHI